MEPIAHIARIYNHHLMMFVQALLTPLSNRLLILPLLYRIISILAVSAKTGVVAIHTAPPLTGLA